MHRGWRAAITILILATAATARAQSADPPRVTANVGVGYANPLDADLSFTPFTWQAALRVRTASHLFIEASYGEWRQVETRVMTAVPITGPGGPLGQIDRITERTEQSRPSIGFNLLGAWTAGRATFTAGGGPAMLLYRRTFTQVLEGCHGVTLKCTTMENEFSNGAFAIQTAAALDVTIASRLGAFGEFRFAVPPEDPAGGQTSFIAGLRVALW